MLKFNLPFFITEPNIITKIGWNQATISDNCKLKADTSDKLFLISIAETIRQALDRFVAQRQKPRKKLSFVGIGRSGRKDVSERSEELLWTKPVAEIGAKV